MVRDGLSTSISRHFFDSQHLNYPDPPTLAFFLFGKSKGFSPKKNQGLFLFADPLKSLEKDGKTLQKKQGKSEKKQGNQKKGLAGQGNFCLSATNLKKIEMPYASWGAFS